MPIMPFWVVVVGLVDRRMIFFQGVDIPKREVTNIFEEGNLTAQCKV